MNHDDVTTLAHNKFVQWINICPHHEQLIRDAGDHLLRCCSTDGAVGDHRAS